MRFSPPSTRGPARAGAAVGTRSGTLYFTSTYTEEANVSFHHSQFVSESVSTSSPAELAACITRILQSSENSFQITAEQDCTILGGSALKAVRRVLPLSKESRQTCAVSSPLDGSKNQGVALKLWACFSRAAPLRKRAVVCTELTAQEHNMQAMS
eukprot:1297616-Amphidinium_carterae.1